AVDVFDAGGNPSAGRVITAFTPYADDLRFQDHAPSTIQAALARVNDTWIETLRQAPTRLPPVLGDPSQGTGPPLMNVAVPYHAAGQAGQQWIVLTLWQTRLLKALSYERGTSGYLLDADLGPAFGPRLGAEVADAVVATIKGLATAQGFKRLERPG